MQMETSAVRRDLRPVQLQGQAGGGGGVQASSRWPHGPVAPSLPPFLLPQHTDQGSWGQELRSPHAESTLPAVHPELPCVPATLGMCQLVCWLPGQAR